MPAYYNEHDPFAASWLRNLIAAGCVAPGDVDERSIVDVRADDLKGYTQCHFFAGIGGWSLALRTYGWPDDLPVWTGSCPCQPFSLAGQQKGFADERHLWPTWRDLIAERRPAEVFGEQVASATAWLGLVRGDMEALDYAVGCMPFEAASAGADHLRNRFGIVAHDTRERRGKGRTEHGVRIGRGIAATGDDSAGNDVANNNNKGSQGRALLSERAGQRIAGPDGVAHADIAVACQGRQQRSGEIGGAGRTAQACDGGDVADGQIERRPDRDGGPLQGTAERERTQEQSQRCGGDGGPYLGVSIGNGRGEKRDHHGEYDWPQFAAAGEFDWVIGADGKARRVKPGIRLLVDGFPNRVGLLRGFGNAIDPRAFAQFIGAAVEAVEDFRAMTAAALASDPPEMFHYDRQRSPGVYIALPPGEARDQALRCGIAAMIRKSRRYMRAKEGEGTHWSEGYGGRVIEWALSLKPAKETSKVRAPSVGEAPVSSDVLANLDQQISDAGAHLREGDKATMGQAPQPPELESQNTREDRPARPDPLSLFEVGIPATEVLIQAIAADAEAECDHPVSEIAASSQARVIEDSPSAHNDSLNQNNPSEEINPAVSPVNDLEAKTPSEEITPKDSLGITDPIIRALCEANDARTLYPAGHVVSHTNPLVNGVMVTLGTCQCGVTFQYPWTKEGRAALMPAAIEAHWQKFDAAPDKVDGRGQPINAEDGATATTGSGQRKRSSDKRRRGAQPKAGDILELANAALPEPVSDTSHVEDTGSPLIEPGAGGPPPAPLVSAPRAAPSDGADASIQAAQICAPLLSDDDDLDIEWPSYDSFLEDKIVTAPMRGIEVLRDELHPWLKPHCKDLVVWALRLGCAAIFANFGLHKTAMQLEWCRQLHKRVGGATLNVVPLGVRHGFIKEAIQLDMDVRFIRTNEEYHALTAEGVVHFLTNYESIREGKLDPNLFTAVSLDEASVLRSYGSKTFQEFMPLFAKVLFKLVATATPSPNRYKELIHYAGFLGVMDTGLALTRWFQRNSEKAGDLTLYPHKQDEFWMFIHSFCAFLQRPSELGYSDEGYELPPLKLVWHEVPADHSKAVPERDGQGVMFRDIANSLQEAAKSRRDSLAPRVAKMVELIAQDPDSHRIIWHDLEAEREAIEHALPGVVTITGSMAIDAREVRLHDFEEGRIKHFGTKPILSGSGSNFQYHCHKAIYVALPGYGYKFNDFIQSLYRLQRFGQEHPVEVDIIYSEDERAGRAALEEKWARDIEMRTRMSEIIKAHGLNTLPLRDSLLRSIGVKRVEITGENFRAINNDCVSECRTWPDNSVDLMVSSIPFGKQYEYSASYRDFGHSDDNAHFWSQMDFLSTELLRMLKPGRLACIHVKDRVLFGSVTGQGVPTVEPFHAEAIMHYRAHGFQYMGMITVVTDVVRENNQTYRLGWSENCKDGTKMGVGMPEYILLLRKPQSDLSRGYADVPVVKEKGYTASDLTWRFILDRNDAGEIIRDEDGEPNYIDMGRGHGSEPDPNDRSAPELIQSPRPALDVCGYSRARWQIDAHAFWRSSGNRHLTPEEFASFSSADLARLFAKTSAELVYDYEAHVTIGENVERTGTLPATFMAIAPGSAHPDVWTDINRMRTLNMLQQRKGAEMHLCPLQFDIVDRLIERYSNEGDLVFDPFGGLMTVPYRAMLKKRKGAATELSASYFLDGVHYLRMAEEKMAVPEMFDLASLDAVNTPPPSEMMEAETA